MKTISQRELRNGSAAVMRKVAQGESFRVTTRGTPVALVSPIADRPVDELILRQGTGDFSFSHGAPVGESTAEVLADLRGGR